MEENNKEGEIRGREEKKTKKSPRKKNKVKEKTKKGV